MVSRLDLWRTRERVQLSSGRKSRCDESQSHVAWMAGDDGNITL